MEINYDYRVKLRVLNILKDSFGSFVKNGNKANITKIPCVNIETGEEYEVNMGQYLLCLDYSIRFMEREVRKMKQKSARMKMLKLFFPW